MNKSLIIWKTIHINKSTLYATINYSSKRNIKFRFGYCSYVFRWMGTPLGSWLRKSRPLHHSFEACRDLISVPRDSRSAGLSSVEMCRQVQLPALFKTSAMRLRRNGRGLDGCICNYLKIMVESLKATRSDFTTFSWRLLEPHTTPILGSTRAWLGQPDS